MGTATAMPNPYFMVCLCVETGTHDLFQPGGWYLRLTVDAGYGARIICKN